MIANLLVTVLLAVAATEVSALMAPQYEEPPSYERDDLPAQSYSRPQAKAFYSDDDGGPRRRFLRPKADDGGGARNSYPRPNTDDGGTRLNFPRPNAPHGFQFSNFRGPVSGVIEEIEVPYVHPTLGPHSHPTPASNRPSVSFDYVAKPDYAFTFGVQDPESGNAQARQETRDGDTVQGEYTVMEPDGTLRTVVYTADPVHGFQARVKYGPSGLPPPPPPTPTPTSGYTGVAQQQQPRKQQAPPQPHRFKVKSRPAYYEQYDEY